MVDRVQTKTEAQDSVPVLDGQFSLPPLPAVVQKLLALLNSGKTDAGEVAELLAADPSLTGQILKIVNSAYFGLPTEIRGVRHAVAYLGLAEIKRLTLSAAVMDKLSPDSAEQSEQFWFHSFYTTLAAKAIAKRYARAADPDDLHVGALLHDVGKLVYIKFAPEPYKRLTDYCREHGALLVDAERALDLPSHQALGQKLCDHWSLPDSVRLACGNHELEDLRGEVCQRQDAPRVIATANLLVNLAVGELDNETKTRIHEATLETLGCEESEFLLLMAELIDVQADVQRFLREL